MRVVYFLMVSFSLLFASCSQNEKVNKDIINKDTLINVIVDMHLGDAILLEPTVISKQIVINKQEYYSAILKKHSIKQEDFQKSVDYYSQSPEKYEKLYETVVERITQLQGVLLSKDSLNNKLQKE